MSEDLDFRTPEDAGSDKGAPTGDLDLTTAPADSAPADSATAGTAPVDTTADTAPVDTTADTAPADTAPADSATADTAPVDAPGVTEDAVLSFLKDSGIEASSLDDLRAKPTEDEDPYIAKLKEWRDKTGRPIEDFAKYNKDYSKVADLDAIREDLLEAHPDLTQEEIDLEMEVYTPDEYADEADIKRAALKAKKDARAARSRLQERTIQFGEPTQEANMPKEVRETLNQVQGLKEQIAESNRKEKVYKEGLEQYSSNLDSLAFKAGDLDLTFQIPDDQKKDMYKHAEANPGWLNDDGTRNPEAIVRDIARLRNMDTMIKIAYEQGVSAGTEQVINQSTNGQVTEGLTHEAGSGNGKASGIVIEGLGRALGENGMKIKY